MTTVVDPKIYSDAARDLQTLFDSIWQLPAVNNALNARDIGCAGDYSAADSWNTALQARLQETWNVFIRFLDGFTPLCNGIATAGYNWDAAECTAAQQDAPQQPATVDLKTCGLEDVTRSGTTGDGLHTTLAGLEDAIGQPVPNGDTAGLGALGDAWHDLTSSTALSGAGAEIRRIAGTFSAIQGAPDQPGMQDLLGKLAAGADAVVAASTVVHTATYAHRDALQALRQDLVQQAPALLTGLIGTPASDNASVTLPAPGFSLTSLGTGSSGGSNATAITDAGHRIGTMITTSSLVAKVLADPPAAVDDIDQTTSDLAGIGTSINLPAPGDIPTTAPAPAPAPAPTAPASTGDWSTTGDWDAQEPGPQVGRGVETAPNMDGLSPERQVILQRGLDRAQHQIGYSQSAYTNGYRDDCSGFVSAAWGLPGPGLNTTGLMGSDVSTGIDYSDLQPGDALIRSDHTMLFGGWTDASHTQFVALEDDGTDGTVSHVYTCSSPGVPPGGYGAYRKNGL